MTMKKTVLTFGLISGTVSSAMLLLSLPLIDRIGFENGMILGYTTIVASFLLVFFGIRSYRDQTPGGTLTFGRAFQVGILITLISCACYVATWEIVYFKLKPGFTEKYAAYALEQVRKSGASAEEIAATERQMQEFKVQYDKVWVNAAYTFMEPFPVGLLVTVISAFALRRKRAHQGVPSRA
jgi:uncharacterized membrane protein (UPF0136 family)